MPEVPVFQAFRGWLYSFGMKACGPRFRVSFNVVLNHLEKMEVGKNVYLACGCVLTGAGDLFIGSDVLVGPNVIIATSRHRLGKTNFLDGYEHGRVTIEEGAWIGGNATLLPGTRVPATSVVGAGAVCNKDYGDNKIFIAGVPAKVVKSIEYPEN